MRCSICGNEINKTTGTCPNCASNLNRVQVLSPDERENFNGPTIEQDGDRETKEGTHSPFQKVFVFNSASAGTMPKLLLNGILLLLAICFLPLALLLAVTIGLNWLSGRGRR